MKSHSFLEVALTLFTRSWDFKIGMRGDHSGFSNKALGSLHQTKQRTTTKKRNNLECTHPWCWTHTALKGLWRSFLSLVLVWIWRAVTADYWGKHWDCQNKLCLDISLHSSNVFNVHSWSQFDFDASSQKGFLSCPPPCQTLIAFTLVSALLFIVTGLLLIGFSGNLSSLSF